MKTEVSNIINGFWKNEHVKASIIDCVNGYTAPETWTDRVQQIIYRICELVKGIFGLSDWQEAVHALEPLNYFIRPEIRNTQNQKILNSEVKKHSSLTLEILIEKNGKNDPVRIAQLVQKKEQITQQICNKVLAFSGYLSI